MLWLPKWLNKWLDQAEEDGLVDPSRRVFLGGMIATAGVLAAPTVFSFPSEIVSCRDWGIPLELRPGGGLMYSQTIAMEIEKVSHKLPFLYDRDNMFYNAIGGFEGYGLPKQKRKKETLAPETDRFTIQSNGRDDSERRDQVGRRALFQGRTRAKPGSARSLPATSAYKGLEGLYGDDCWP